MREKKAPIQPRHAKTRTPARVRVTMRGRTENPAAWRAGWMGENDKLRTRPSRGDRQRLGTYRRGQMVLSWGLIRPGITQLWPDVLPIVSTQVRTSHRAISRTLNSHAIGRAWHSSRIPVHPLPQLHHAHTNARGQLSGS